MWESFLFSKLVSDVLQVGPSLGYVSRSDKLYSCCAATAYSLSIGPVEIPATAVSFRIAINSSHGELPYGKPVEYSDRTETEVMSTLKPITSGLFKGMFFLKNGPKVFDILITLELITLWRGEDED